MQRGTLLLSTITLAISSAGCTPPAPSTSPTAPATIPAVEDSGAPVTTAVNIPVHPVQRPVDTEKNKLQLITFDDLKIDMPADTVFARSMLTDRVKQLEGARIRIRGFLFPASFKQTGITQFPLIMNMQCKFGPGGQAHHIILVELIDGASTDYTTRPIAVTGRLTVQPWAGPDGNTWALYHMSGEEVE